MFLGLVYSNLRYLCVVTAIVFGICSTTVLLAGSAPLQTPGDEFWDDQFVGPLGVDGIVKAMAVAPNGDLYIAGNFAWAGNVRTNNIARWDGNVWSALENGITNGLNGDVRAMVVDSAGTLYVGGFFFTGDGTQPDFIAKWNGTTWLKVGGGVNSPVNALAARGTTIFVGGDFTKAGGVSANHIAQWDGKAWSALSDGVDNSVRAIAATAKRLYIGGAFEYAGSTKVNHVARWTGTAWNDLNGGVGGTSPIVTALAASGNQVYVGGSFDQAGTVSVANVARWNPSGWDALEGGVGHGISDYPVSSILIAAGNVYVGGKFERSSFAGTARFLGAWNVNARTWNSLGTIGRVDYNTSVNGLALLNGDLVVGGNFTSVADTSVGSLARWHNASWSAFGDGAGSSPNSIVNAIAVRGNRVFIAGEFTRVGGVPARHVAQWNKATQAWSEVGGGVALAPFSDDFPAAYALAIQGKNVYVGGEFFRAGQTSVSGVARWDGSVWHAVGESSLRYVLALTVDEAGNLYAGTPFGLYRWDRVQWEWLGSVGGEVRALAYANGSVYVGGRFTEAGGISVKNIVRYDTAKDTWHALGSGIVGEFVTPVQALAASGNIVYAGGGFKKAGGVDAHNVAKWDGSAWSALGNGVDGEVQALAVDGQALYAGGSLYALPPVGTRSNGIAKWDGTQWHALGNGVEFCYRSCSPTVKAIAVSNENVFVGGMFTTAGNRRSNYFGSWNRDAIPPTPVPCTAKPQKPVPQIPHKGSQIVSPHRVGLWWTYAACADSYHVIVRQDSKNGAVVADVAGLSRNTYKTPKLTPGTAYFWRVNACNTYGCKASTWWNFAMR